MFTITFAIGQQTVILGDDSNGILVSGYERQGASKEQVTSILRAEEISIFDRGNFQTQIAFRTSRQFTDYNGAVDFINSHPEDLVGVGILTISMGGSSFQQWTMRTAKATVRFAAGNLAGIHIFCDYQIIGGKLTAG